MTDFIELCASWKETKKKTNKSWSSLKTS
jgi:hypothetical protein